MAAGSARTHARSEGPWHHRRTAGPTGAHAGWKLSWEEHPTGRRTFGTAGTKHAVVIAERVLMPGDGSASEEDNRHDENNAGDDHHPRRGLEEPRRLRYVRRRRAGGWRLDLVLGCLGHPSIMPTCEPAIKHRALFNRAAPTVLTAQEPGEPQNDHGNEHDPRNDRHPRRCLIKPLRMFLRRRDKRRRDGRRRNRRLRCVAHASSSCLRSAIAATGRRPLSVAGKSWSPAPRCGDAGLTVTIAGLRVRRSQRWSDRLRWL